jgi:hypothetical protein
MAFIDTDDRSKRINTDGPGYELLLALHDGKKVQYDRQPIIGWCPSLHGPSPVVANPFFNGRMAIKYPNGHVCPYPDGHGSLYEDEAAWRVAAEKGLASTF